MPSTLSREVHMHDVVHSFPSGRCLLIASRMPRRHLREVRRHTHALQWHSACTIAWIAEDHAASPECFPTEGGCFTYRYLLPFRRPQVPCSPQAQGTAPSLSSLGGGYQSERGKENACGYECTAACGHWCLLYPAHPGLVEMDCTEKQSHTNKL